MGDDKKLEKLLHQFYSEIKEDKEPRTEAKEIIKPPLDFLIANVTENDPRFAGSVGIVSRSYRGTGTYGATDFDIQLPLVPPDGARVVPGKLPNVSIELDSPSTFWLKSSDRGKISASKLRNELHQKLVLAAGAWNLEHAEEIEIDVPDLSKRRAPVMIKITPTGKQSISLDCTPIFGNEGLPGLDEIKEVIKSPQNPAKWPESEEMREQIANQMLLVPAPDAASWAISLMIGQKTMVKALDDGGETCRFQLYKTLKMINKYAWCNSPNDHEMVKLGNHCLQNILFKEIAKHPDSDYWRPDNLVKCFKRTLSSIKCEFASGEAKEYMVPGAPSLMAEYKQSNGFLIPKLGGMVRRMEFTMSSPAKVLETLILKWKRDGKLTRN